MKEPINRQQQQSFIKDEQSVLANLGSCRDAAVCFLDGLISKPIVSDLAVLWLSISYHGKLCALRLATAFTADYCETHLTRQIHIFSDCKSVIAFSASLDLRICHQNVIEDIQKDVAALSNMGVTTNIHWVAEHADFAQNELTDKAAKSAADREDNNVSSHVYLTLHPQGAHNE